LGLEVHIHIYIERERHLRFITRIFLKKISEFSFIECPDGDFGFYFFVKDMYIYGDEQKWWQWSTPSSGTGRQDGKIDAENLQPTTYY
jgi:hypothetical protein